MLKVGKAEIDEEMMIAMSCEKMGWNYKEFLDQPQWLIETLWLKWKCDGESEEESIKQSKIK